MLSTVLGASEELKMKQFLLPLPKQEREVRVRLGKVSLRQVIRGDSDGSLHGPRCQTGTWLRQCCL